MEHFELGEIGFISGRWPLDPHKPTILFLHGGASNNSIWKYQVEALKDSSNTVAMDLPGHGASKGPGKTTIPDYAKSVLEFLDHLKAPQPIPCGISMGGAIVLQLLIDHQERFAAGILINTAARIEFAPMLFDVMENNYDHFIEMVCMSSISAKTDSERLREDIEYCLQCRGDVALRDFRVSDTFDVTSKLGSIEAPVLVLTASDDNVVPVSCGNALGKDIKNARVVKIEDVGHFSPLEKPVEVSDLIDGFLGQSLRCPTDMK